jgi:molybdopterin-guanine dinucleotide biosynthesis protein A
MYPISGVILAGGKSRRMNADKAFLKIEGRPIIERVLEKVTQVAEEVILVTNTSDAYRHLGLPTVSDVFPGKGALGGIYSGLEAASHSRALVVACDMPFLNAALLRFLVVLSAGYDVVVPRTEQGLEPLHAIYAKSCRPAIEALLRQDNLKIIDFFSQVQARYVGQEEMEVLDPQLLSIFNVNRPEDLTWARQKAAEMAVAGR